MKKVFLIMFIIFCVIVPASSAQDGWEEHRTRHFYIYYKEAPQDFIYSVEDAAERYYEEITDNLGFKRYRGWSFDDRASIYIYRDRDDYVYSAKQARWSHGSANARKKIIRTFPSSHGFFDSTLPHELGHIIFREFIGFQSYIPKWLEEGVASFQEKAKRWGAHRMVKRALENGTFIPLEDLSRVRLYSDTNPQVVNLFYAESASVVYYMITELGKQRFVKLCRELKKGQSFEYAFRATYRRFKDINDLNRSWVRYIESEY